MESINDSKVLIEQINKLKDHNERTKDYLAAIQLLMVDNNNGRIKDQNLTPDLDNLHDSINHLNTEIEAIVSKISAK